MKRLFPAIMIMVLLASACSGGAPTPEDSDGIAALEEAAPSPTEEEVTDAGDKGKKKAGTKEGKKGSSSKSSGDSENDGNEDTDSGSSGSDGEGTGGDSSGGGTATAAAPIPQGRYGYATEGQRTVSGNSEDLPKNTTLTAQSPSNSVQKQLRDLRDQDGHGTLTESHVVYRPDGVYLSYIKVTSKFQGGFTDVREFKLPRPELIAPTGAGPGFKRSFTMEGSGTRADVTVAAKKFENVTVGGRTIKTLVVQTRIVFSGSLEGEQNSTTWFWPKHALAVKEQVRTDVSSGPIRLQGSYQATLKKI